MFTLLPYIFLASIDFERLVGYTSETERTEVIYGPSNVIDKEIQFFPKAALNIDSCMDNTRPALALGIDSIRTAFLDAKSRNVKLRYITEITTENAEQADIEVFYSATRAREVSLDIVRRATNEILLIFPTLNAFYRQSKIGAIALAEKAAERNVKVRILMPAANRVIDGAKLNPKLNPKSNLEQSHKIELRHIEQMSDTKATILVIDRKESLVMELKDDSKTTFDEAIGLSTYSNSKAGVLSYVAIFDNLWKQMLCCTINYVIRDTPLTA